MPSGWSRHCPKCGNTSVSTNGPVNSCFSCDRRSQRRSIADIYSRKSLFGSHQPVVSGGLDASDLEQALVRPEHPALAAPDRWARRRQAVDDAQDVKLDRLRRAHRAAWAEAAPGAPGIRLTAGELGMAVPDEGVPPLDWWPARRG